MRTFLVLLIVIIGGMIGFQQYVASRPSAVQYVTASARIADVTESVAVTGAAEPIELRVVQPEVPGVVEEVLVDFNEMVKEGQVLAKLSSDVQRVKLMQANETLQTAKVGVELADVAIMTAKAGVDAARSALKAAEKDHETAQDSLKNALIPEAKADAARFLLEQAEANVEAAIGKQKQAQVQKLQAESQVNSAKVAVDAARLTLEKTELRSTMSGMVLNKDIRIGDTVGGPKVSLTQSALGLFEICAPLNRMRGIVKVSEADYSKVKLDQAATFTIDAYPDEVFDAKVVQIRNAPSADRMSSAVSYDTVLEFDNRRDPNTGEWMVKPKSTVSADIRIRQSTHVLTVPNSALLFTPTDFDAEIPHFEKGEGLIWSVDKNGKLFSRVIKVGITDGFLTEVVGGDLKEGDEVITAAPPTEDDQFKLPISL